MKQQLKTLLAFAEKPQPAKAEIEDQEPAEADDQDRGRGLHPKLWARTSQWLRSLNKAHKQKKQRHPSQSRS